MFQKKTLIVGFIVVALGLAFGTFFIRSNHRQDTKQVKASSNTASITTQAEWNTGTKVNIDSSTSPGSIEISDKSQSLIGAGTWSSNSSGGGSSLDVVHDGNTGGSSFLFNYNPGEYIEHDFGSEVTFLRTTIFSDTPPPPEFSWNLTYQYWDGGGWVQVFSHDCSPGSCYPYDSVHAPITTTKVRLFSGVGSSINIYELSDYSGGVATSTIQIDGGANFWQWETFSDSKTVPVSTSVAYRYRTSSNGTDWTGWVGSIGAVTSRTGDDSNNPTKYRYLQIEATLSNTNGTSTPTIDSYDIGYHTNQKPNAPTAMTAVVN
ncbi:MAG: hypothetical protein ABH810_01465 [bacterium]